MDSSVTVEGALVTYRGEDEFLIAKIKDQYVGKIGNHKTYFVVEGTRYPIQEDEEGKNFRYLYIVFSIDGTIPSTEVKKFFKKILLYTEIPVSIYKNFNEDFPFDRMNDINGRLDRDKDGNYIATPLYDMIAEKIFIEDVKKLSDNIYLIELGS